MSERRYNGWAKEGEHHVDFDSEAILVKITERSSETGEKIAYQLAGQGWDPLLVCEGCAAPLTRLQADTPEKRKLLEILAKNILSALKEMSRSTKRGRC